jgi:hypothetical protein
MIPYPPATAAHGGQQPLHAPPKRQPSVASQMTPVEVQAKEKLCSFIYEYLTHIGASKTAETLKNEVLQNQNISVGEHPGFLSQWFTIFWDLYVGDPDYRDKNNPTQEAKAFHDFGFVQPTSLRPGYMGPPMGMGPPPDGMMSPYFRPPPYGGRMPHNFGPPGGPMFPPGGDVRAMNQNRMPRMASNMNFPMRPPQRYGPPYMDSPTGNPGGFQQFMPPDQMPPPSSMTPSTSIPTSMSMNGQMPMSESGGPQPLPSLSSSNPLTGIMNGEEIKHSPSHHIGSVHGQNGGIGTPLGPGSQHTNMVGPGSAAPGAPTSVQSHPGSVNPSTSASQQQQPSQSLNPIQSQTNFSDHSNIMDFQNEIPNNNPSSHENLEIKKIREGLLDDFQSS